MLQGHVATTYRGDKLTCNTHETCPMKFNKVRNVKEIKFLENSCGTSVKVSPYMRGHVATTHPSSLKLACEYSHLTSLLTAWGAHGN